MIETLEHLKHQRLVLRVEPDTIIPHYEMPAAAFDGPPDVNVWRDAGLCELYGVREEILDEEAHHRGVSPYAGKRVTSDDGLGVADRELRVQDGFIDDVVDVDPIKSGDTPNTGKPQQVEDKLLPSLCRPRDVFELLEPFWWEPVAEVLPQKARPTRDRAKRLLKIVARSIGQDLSFLLRSLRLRRRTAQIDYVLTELVLDRLLLRDIGGYEVYNTLCRDGVRSPP